MALFRYHTLGYMSRRYLETPAPSLNHRSALAGGAQHEVKYATMEQTPYQQPLSNLAIIIQQGKILDFIDGHTQRPDTPEEHVRQEIAKSLVREYRYEKANIEVEFTVRVGSRKPRADQVILPPSALHTQGAKVTATNVATGLSTTVARGMDGSYEFLQLPAPASYTGSRTAF
jgi:hypothetical protein